jgi:hypothetical protein
MKTVTKIVIVCGLWATIQARYFWKTRVLLLTSLKLLGQYTEEINELGLTFFSWWSNSPACAWTTPFSRFRYHRRTTFGMNPLDDGSACHRLTLPINTRYSQETNIHAPGGIRTRGPRKRAAADLYLSPRGNWYRACFTKF